MKGLKPFPLFGLGLVLCLVLSGCSGSTPTNGPGALNIGQFTLAQGVVNVPYRQLLIASGGQTPFTWTLTSGSMPPGLTLASSGVISGTPTTAGTFNFQTKVTDSQTPTAAFNTYSGSIVINPPLSLAPAPLASATVGVSYSASVTATGGVSPYAYNLASGNLPDGLAIDATGLIKGTPTKAGTFSFTVQATDSISDTTTGTFSITVKGRLQGAYAFTFSGFNNGQPFYMAGSFVADGNGNISSGVFDRNGSDSIGLQTGPSGVALTPGAGGSATGCPAPSTATGSVYCVNTNNLGTLTLASALGSYTFNVAVSGATDSRMIMADPANPQMYGSGTIKQQASTQLLNQSAGYAFGFFGNDSGSERYAGAGMFSTDGSQNVTGGAEDTNDNGTASGETAITGGCLASACPGGSDNSTGRGTLMLTTAAGTTNYATYVVSATELIAIETDSGGALTLYSILQQGAAGAIGNGSFSNSSLKGQSVMQLNAINSTGSSPLPDISVGVASFDGAGNIARTDGLAGFFTDENNAGVVSQNSFNGTYNVDATCGSITTPCGRVTVSLTGATNNPVWYLVSTNQAFVVGTDPGVTAGSLVQQNVPNSGFTIAALLGSFYGGTVTPVVSSVTNEIQVATTPPPGGIWDLTYDTSGPAGLQSNQMFSGNYDCGTLGEATCSTMGTAFGRFEITSGTAQGSPVLSVLYVQGLGSVGVTNAKLGILGVDVMNADGSANPNPRITVYGR